MQTLVERRTPLGVFLLVLYKRGNPPLAQLIDHQPLTGTMLQMFNNDEQAPPPYDFIDKTITPPRNPLAEPHHRQLTSRDVTSVSPALAAPNNPILLARLFGQGPSTKLIIST